MDQPYSFGADLLSKFHTAPEWIQALWLIAPMLTVLGIAYLAAQVSREALRLHKVESQLGALEGRLLYGIYKNAHGELMLYVHGKTESLSAEDLPPRLKLLQ
ncbi:hypothetical protein DC522_02340 [Microvirga sp. KLBC 81]|uniref:hypothetical protein n=1 Tax=Microvirga sp. KLBC 81 TaxID=1862707 RepID=UPI000D524222|nr:hypothetical protein [Microvirga sp. KLBC 81]PVE26086.1 hypothetical protein DC522_02340 [Microvirga sp. KLBC 81]